MRFAVVVFPGSNCDHDCYHVLSKVLGLETVYVWHQETDVREADCVILPGGFSYGDYLRAGAIARFSPVMQAVWKFAEKGGLVLGICNGFQVLTESRLLPGALLPNLGGRFICQDVYLRVENTNTPFTNLFSQGEVIKIPIAHQEGNYFAQPQVIKKIQAEKQVTFRYCGPGGEMNAGTNPNGSLNAIAGIISERGNVLGLMPHPERASEEVLGSVGGKRVFQSVVKWLEEQKHGSR